MGDVSTCITGQDGSYLAELLLAKGYEVHVIVRRRAYSRRNASIMHVDAHPNPHLHDDDWSDAGAMRKATIELRELA